MKYFQYKVRFDEQKIQNLAIVFLSNALSPMRAALHVTSRLEFGVYGFVLV